MLLICCVFISGGLHHICFLWKRSFSLRIENIRSLFWCTKFGLIKQCMVFFSKLKLNYLWKMHGHPPLILFLVSKKKIGGNHACIFQRWLSFNLEKNAIHCFAKVFTNIVNKLHSIFEKCVVTPPISFWDFLITLVKICFSRISLFQHHSTSPFIHVFT